MLSPADAEAVVAELRRLRDTPPPTDPTAAGCVVAMCALIALVLMPVAARALPLGSAGLFAVGVTLAVLVVGGTAVGVLGGRSGRDGPSARVEAAVASLRRAAREGDAGAMRAAALTILLHATAPAGPTTLRVYDPGEVATALGDALPYVLEVERLLVGRGELDAVFTGPGGGAGSAS